MTEAVLAERTTSSGMRVFLTIWVGQVISMVGSDLTGFALGVWVFQKTGSVTRFSLIILCAELPGIILSPLVGAVVDRHDRRALMILSNVVACLSTLAIALLFMKGWLRLWHICILIAFISTCASFLRPAFSASISLLVAKRHLGRASGMVQTGQASAQIVSPLLAGFLVLVIKIQGVLLIDCLTYLPAILTLLIVSIPSPAKADEATTGKASLLREAVFGWRYIVARPGIFSLLIFFAITNFTVTMSNILITPLVLSFANAAVYGSVLSVTGAGVFAGGMLMSFWGGPKHRIYGVFFYGVIQGLALICQGLRPNAVLIGTALFCAAFSAPIVSGCFIPILQSKSAPAVQGRVFAAVRLVSWCSVPVAYILAGPLSDKVFQPLLAPDGPLAGSVGRVVGVGPGRGIGLLLMLMGVLTLLATLRAYLYPHLRRIEVELPDVLPDAVVVAKG